MFTHRATILRDLGLGERSHRNVVVIMIRRGINLSDNFPSIRLEKYFLNSNDIAFWKNKRAIIMKLCERLKLHDFNNLQIILFIEKLNFPKGHFYIKYQVFRSTGVGDIVWLTLS